MRILFRNKPFRAISTKGIKGQTTIEFALGMLLFIFIILAIIQFGIVIYAQLIVTEAAQEGARLAASADNDLNDGITAATRNLDTGLGGGIDKDVKGSADGNKVTIEASVQMHSFLPFVGPIIKFDLQSKANMYKEGWRS